MCKKRQLVARESTFGTADRKQAITLTGCFGKRAVHAFKNVGLYWEAVPALSLPHAPEIWRGHLGGRVPRSGRRGRRREFLCASSLWLSRRVCCGGRRHGHGATSCTPDGATSVLRCFFDVNLLWCNNANGDHACAAGEKVDRSCAQSRPAHAMRCQGQG
jgi:hypothetical protein